MHIHIAILSFQSSVRLLIYFYQRSAKTAFLRHTHTRVKANVSAIRKFLSSRSALDTQEKPVTIGEAIYIIENFLPYHIAAKFHHYAYTHTSHFRSGTIYNTRVSGVQCVLRATAAAALISRYAMRWVYIKGRPCLDTWMLIYTRMNKFKRGCYYSAWERFHWRAREWHLSFKTKERTFLRGRNFQKWLVKRDMCGFALRKSQWREGVPISLSLSNSSFFVDSRGVVRIC